jgi:hypothetical protein
MVPGTTLTTAPTVLTLDGILHPFTLKALALT